MLPRTLAATAFIALAAAGPAAAAQAPTLGPPTVLSAGQKTPVDVGGNDLHHGDTIRKGTELRRFPVTMHGRSSSSVKLSCGTGTHIGLALLGRPQVYFAVSKNSSYYHHTIRVHFYARNGVDPDGAHGSVYALCKTA